MRKVGVKFCGGCNPAIDRVRVFQEIRDRANGLTFTGPGEKELGAVLFICGCPAACPVEQLDFRAHPALVIVAGES
ncbi:MAG: hypothetical protein Q7O66_19390, partial [Dehalococcoidia bacterium]|nr:hypothetical protein [Dehalococcoidia bacterium]